MFRRITAIVAAGLFLGGSGCVNVRVTKPLVDLGEDTSYQARPVEQPPAGLTEQELTEEQRLQRRLAECQQAYADLKLKYEELEEECD